MRPAFQKHLKDAGISTAIHYPQLIPNQRALTEMGNFDVLSSLSMADAIAGNVISIPNHPYMTDDEIDFCIETINKCKLQ
jgi:dTDP-4-amino-4,6-dideoxygalactose transaminase